MLAGLTLFLHEMTDSLRGRVHPRRLDTRDPGDRSDPCAGDPWVAPTGSLTAEVIVTGLASPGKTRLVEALRRRLSPARMVVRVGAIRQVRNTEAAVLHVHAETDLEAMVEGGLQPGAREASRRADLLVAVDWERVERSVNRVVEALIARGVDVDTPGE